MKLKLGLILFAVICLLEAPKALSHENRQVGNICKFTVQSDYDEPSDPSQIPRHLYDFIFNFMQNHDGCFIWSVPANPRTTLTSYSYYSKGRRGFSIRWSTDEENYTYTIYCRRGLCVKPIR